MQNSKTLKRLILISTLLVLTPVLAAGVYTQASKFQKKQKDHPRTYEATKVKAAPEVRSAVKGLDISSVSLINEGTPEAAVVINVINQRDEDVMAVDFIAGVGKSTSSGLAMDGLSEESDPLVIIPRHSLKTFTWNLGSILDGETIFLAVAIFSDGKEEGYKRYVDGLKKVESIIKRAGAKRKPRTEARDEAQTLPRILSRRFQCFDHGRDHRALWEYLDSARAHVWPTTRFQWLYQAG